MELNLDYLDDEYVDNISAYDSKIIEKYFSNNEITDSRNDLNYYLLFSKNRANIINWYEFKESPTILDINPNFGEIDSYLAKKSQKLDIISESSQKTKSISKYCSDDENVCVYVGNLDKVDLSEKYDYVIIIGDVTKNSLKLKLKYAKEHLKRGGKILLSFDNKLGIQYWAGIKGNDYPQYASMIGATDGVGLHDAKKYIEKNKLKYKLYFPVPDYKITNAIYSENKLPDYESTFSRNLEYYQSEENANFSQCSALVELIKDDPKNFYSFSNSYFFELANSNVQNDIVYANFEVLRKDKYHIKTTMKDKYVYKTTNLPEAENHIKQIANNIDLINKYKINTLDKYENDVIISKISKEQTVDKILDALYKDDKADEMYALFDEFINNTIKKLEVIDRPEDTIFKRYGVEVDESVESNFHYVKHGLTDLLTQNTFYIGKKFYVYDQEWLEENAPMEYLIYRNILYNVSFDRNKLRDEFYKRYGLSDYVSLFRKLDDTIQESIREEVFWDFYINSVRKARPEFNKLNIELAQKNAELNELNAMVSDLNEKYRVASQRADTFEKNLRIIEASLSWKITKPFRYISWKLKQLKRRIDGGKQNK